MEVYRGVIVIHVILIVQLSRSNVASGYVRPNALVSYALPEARELKMALGYLEDTYLNFTELVAKHGYQAEEHTVTTEDGYILTAFRILPKCSEPVRLYPALLMHGFVDSSDLWVVAGPKLGLGFILADSCYDVWALNHRGNTYSRRHVTLDPNKDKQYWEYSFDEHGNYDVPAFVDYMIRVTSKPKVFYIGHSQGTTDFFIMTSLRPEYNEKVQFGIEIGPVAWMGNIYSPIIRLLAPHVKILKEILDGAGFREVLGKQQLSHFLTEMFCHFAPEITCSSALTITTGYQEGTIRRDLLMVAFGHLLSGTSSKTLVHYAQLIISAKFKRFDEGFDGNMKRYGTDKSPDYNVSKISCPVLLISAQNDWLSSLKDVKKLSSRLPNLVENYIVPEEKWSHHNHVWDERALTFVIPKILHYLNRYNV